MVASLLTTDLASLPMTSEARMAESFFRGAATFADQPLVPVYLQPGLICNLVWLTGPPFL